MCSLNTNFCRKCLWRSAGVTVNGGSTVPQTDHPMVKVWILAVLHKSTPIFRDYVRFKKSTFTRQVTVV